MATEQSDSTTDHSDQTSTPDETTLGPPADPRADYDYVGGEIDRPDLVAALCERIAGPDVERVAANTYGIMEYVDRFDLLEALPVDDEDGAARGRLTYHGHCHQKVTKKDGHAASVFEAAGFDVDALDSGCCGMAGSFGYEAEHYSLRRTIGEIRFEQVDDSDGETVVAPGASCRTQLADHEDKYPSHPVEKLEVAVR